MNVYLIDGTYELFRMYFALPSHVTAGGLETAAVRGVLADTLRLLESGSTHVGVATDKVIESFRNDLWPGYKTSAGIPAELASQFGLLEEALAAAGVVVWDMVEREADDALASAAAVAAADSRVDQVVIRTVDKDLAQCVGGVVVQYDRRADRYLDPAGVLDKYGVPPASIPDWLALVGDSADGFPGLPGFGKKTAATLLARYGTIEAIPDDAGDWDIAVRGAPRLAATLASGRETAALFKNLATLRTSPHVLDDVDTLRWNGPSPAFAEICARIESDELLTRAASLASIRSTSG